MRIALNHRWFLVVGTTVLVIVLGWAAWKPAPPVEPPVQADVESCADCLPRDINLSTRFSESLREINSHGDRETITVRDVLKRVGARCKDGTIYERSGKKVFFWRMHESGKEPGKDEGLRRENEWIKKAHDELTALEVKGTVIRMYETKVPR
jgi:hypothetical protein